MRRIGAVLLVAGLFVAAPAFAAAPKWLAVTGPTGHNSTEVGTIRSPDGTLHVVWWRDTPGSGGATADLLHVAISPGGVVGSATVIASEYSTISNPAIVNTPGGGLQVLFGAIQCVESTCGSGMFSATSDNGGASWSSPIALYDRDANYSSDMNAVTLADGTPLETWNGTAGVFVHLGTTQATSDYDYQGAMGAACCGYYSNLATDSAGNVELAWDSNATGFIGAWARSVDPSSGAPTGSPLLMPGSVTNYGGAPNSSQMLQRTPLISVPGRAGFYMAYPGNYPTTTKVLLWRVGALSSTTIVNQPGGHDEVSLAADANGRIWVFWKYVVNDVPHVYARRLDAAGLEPAIDLGSPAHADSIYALDGAVAPAPNSYPEALAQTGFANGTYGTYYAQGPPVAAPVNGVGVDLIRVIGAGPISFQLRGHGPFFPVIDERQVPVGSVVDASHATHTHQIEAATPRGKPVATNVFGGPFTVSQRRGKSLISLTLAAGSCKPHRVRRMLVAAQSQTATNGTYATATGSGNAVWTMWNECGATRVKVTHGTVKLVDLVRRVTVSVHAGHTYLAHR